MEERFEVKCPKCDAAYRVRYSALGRDAQCPKCQNLFTLAVPEYHPEEEIMHWLSEKPAPAGRALDATVAGLRVVASTGEEEQPEAGRRPLLEEKRMNRLNLYKVDPSRAYFWFPLKLLADPHLRTSFPRICCKSLCKENLNIYLVPWWQHAQAGPSPPQEPLTPLAKLDELPRGKRADLLEYLPKREGVSSPFDLPFPFYICDRCSPEGLIRTNVSGQGDDRRCWISISNLEIACRFFATTRGDKDHDYHKLLVHSTLKKHDRWDDLTPAVQSKLSQWFKPLAGESFVQYLPDGDYVKGSDGSAGLIITDRRLVYHKEQTWRSYPLGESLTICTQTAGSTVLVEIYSVAHGRAVVKLDSKAWANLKHFLKALEARVKFVG